MIFNKNIFNLRDGAYIVTGGFGFLGKAHCHAIAAFGGVPVIIDLETKDHESFAHEIYSKYNKEILSYKADIRNKDAIEGVLNQIKERCDIFGLINNAARNPIVNKSGLKDKSRLEDYSIEDWNLDIGVGLTGAFVCTQVFGKYMALGNGGVIINVSSDLGLIAPKQDLYSQKNTPEDEQPKKPVTYSVVKTGLIGLTRYTSTYWPKKIRCNCICPGGILNNQSDDFIEKINKEIPLGRLANIGEYGGLIIYLLSSASSYMNGAIISVDGGRTTW